MISATILTVDKVMHQESQVYFLDVKFELKKDGEAYSVKSLGFPLDTDKDTILAELTKYCSTLQADLERAEANKDFEAANTKADETIEALSGVVVTADADNVKTEPTN